MIIIELLFGVFLGVMGTLLSLKFLIKKTDEEKETTPLEDSDFDPLDVIKKLKEDIQKKDSTIRETINEVVRIREEKKNLQDIEKKFKELMSLKGNAETSELIWTMNKFQREIDEKNKEEMRMAAATCFSGYAVTGRFMDSKEDNFDRITGEFFKEEQRLESE